MANWTTLKAAIAGVIKTNGNQEITGAVLQNTLNSIVNSVGENATFAGVATPTTNPGTPDGPVFYLATTPGTYSNFGGIKIAPGEAVILEWGGSWTKKTSGFATAEKLTELESLNNHSDNSIALYDGIIQFTNNEDGTVSASIGGSNRQLFCRNKYIGTIQTNSVNVTDYFVLYVSSGSTELKSSLFSTKLAADDIVICRGMIRGKLSSINQIYYSASNEISIDGVIYSTYLEKDITKIVKNTDNSVCFYGSIDFINENDGSISVNISGDKQVFNRLGYIGIISLPKKIIINDYTLIYVNKNDKILKALRFADANTLTDDDIILCWVLARTKLTIDKIIYSACNSISIDSVKYVNYNNIAQEADIERLEKYRSAFIFGENFKIDISTTGEYPIMTLKGFLQMFFSGEVSGVTQNRGFLGTNIDQTFDFSSFSLKDYVRLYFDVANKSFVLKGYNSFTNKELKEFLFIGLFYIRGTQVKGFLHSGQSYYINGREAKGDGTVYNTNDIIGGSNLKYAQIGDSITDIYDNKWEYSWSALSYKETNPDAGRPNSGYKNEKGYGILFAKEVGISYENHYPQGLNGRTFCDYYDDWLNYAEEYGDFPNDIDVWTIFLGTNDWGTERHPLGTQDDYLNDTYTASHRTTYGAIRKIVDRIRSYSNESKKTPRIIFMTPMQRGCFAYGDNPSSVFMKSAIKIGEDGQWEYAANKFGFTLKDVVDAIKWVCEYESLRCVDLFNNSVVDKKFLNMSQTWEELQPNYPSNWIYQDTLYDNLHPTAGVGTKKIAGRLIDECKYDFYDIVE